MDGLVELTRISNIQVTIVEKMSAKDAEAILKGKADFDKSVAATIKKAFEADDVQVETKDFVRDNVQPWKNSIMGHFTKVE